MKTASHTPTPWKIDDEQTDAVIIDCGDGFTKLVCECAGNPQDAAFIVRAVNSHDALVNLLSDGAFQLERLNGDNLTAYARTFAALAQKALSLANS